MSTDDDFARSLRERADAGVPAMSLDHATTLHLGRRRVRTRHAWQVGSVVAAVGVVAVVVVPLTLATAPTEPGLVGVPGPTSTATGGAPGVARPPTDLTALLGDKLVAQAAVLRRDMDDALDTPFDPTVWDAFVQRLDTLADRADVVIAHRAGTDAVELGTFRFPPSYEPRSTEWIGWDDGRRVTVAEDRATHRLHLRLASPSGPGQVVDLPARGHGTLALVTGPAGEALDGSVLTYEDEDGQRFELDVRQHTWLVLPTASADLATSGPTAVPTASDAPTAGTTGTGDGHTAPDAKERAIQRRASLLMQSTSDAVADGDEGAGDPDAAAYWRGLDHELDRLVADAEAQGFSHGDDGARAVELGFFTYPGFLHERAAAWIGWIDGERVTVSFKDGTGRLRYVGPGPGGGRVDVVLPDAGAPMVDIVMPAYDRSLVGTVLGFTDADGKDHHLDLLTRTWLD